MPRQVRSARVRLDTTRPHQGAGTDTVGFGFGRVMGVARAGTAYRWSAVALVTAASVALPVGWFARPVSAPPTSPAQLLRLAARSADVPFEGFAETRGQPGAARPAAARLGGRAARQHHAGPGVVGLGPRLEGRHRDRGR